MTFYTCNNQFMGNITSFYFIVFIFYRVSTMYDNQLLIMDSIIKIENKIQHIKDYTPAPEYNKDLVYCKTT